MEVIDYTRSFVHGTKPYNRVRFVVESRTRLIDEDAGRNEDYVACASCKSEETYAEQDLFYEDNYDFLPVFGPEQMVIFRSKAYMDDRYRTVCPADEPFGRPRYRLQEAPDARRLTSDQAVREATHAGSLLVAQTEWLNRDVGARAIIEYPVKTMNIHDENDWYQVDTGPVAYPDFSVGTEDFAETLRLAFVAFNCASFADFVIEAPTAITGEGGEQTRVPHFSRRISLETENRLYAIDVG